MDQTDQTGQTAQTDLGARPRIDDARLRSLVAMTDAVDALEAALHGGLDPSAGPARSVVGVVSGQMLVMPTEYGGFAGVKLARSHRPIPRARCHGSPVSPSRGARRSPGALREAGDVLTPVRRGVVDAAHAGTGIADLGHGRVPTVQGRPRLLKSVRMAWEDSVIASAAHLRGARDRAASGENRPAG